MNKLNYVLAFIVVCCVTFYNQVNAQHFHRRPYSRPLPPPPVYVLTPPPVCVAPPIYYGPQHPVIIPPPAVYYRRPMPRYYAHRGHGHHRGWH